MSKGGTLKFLSACRVMALYLTLFGYFGNVYSGTVLVNSNNAIKNLPGGGAKPSDAVSPSPGTSLSEIIVQKAPVETLQPGACTEDDECGADEFCNDVRGACLPCRKSRKRCGRDSMCCAGNRCSNGVCQANDVLDPVTESVSRRHNSTMEHHAKRPPPANGGPNQSVKGQEGDTCLRSSDCSEGFCCARHFWSRICKPVLSEGQVCTRHRRKGAHGLELFQRCDCGDGMACRPERGGGGGAAEREHVAPPAPAAAGAGRTGARNLHTCQRR